MATQHFINRRTGIITPVAVGSIAQANRHTGKPHKHEREIARRDPLSLFNQGNI